MSRIEAIYRPLLNEAALIERLRGLDITIFAPGMLSLRTQVEAYSGSRCMIGWHGAGMANIMSCKPGTTVIELFPKYCVNELFDATASVCGLRYGYLSGTSVSRDDADLAKAQPANWSAPWVIDVASVEKLARATFF